MTPGAWFGGDATDNNPFFICLNVSSDGRRLTAQGTKCRGNQGQNRNSIDIQFQGGQTPSGSTCNQYSYRNIQQGDVTIGSDGKFVHTFKNANIDTTITGTFDAANNSVSGTARSVNQYIDCSVSWTASPESSSNNRPTLPPPPPPPPPAPPPPNTQAGITPGQWEGGNAATEDPFYICLNVSSDGRRLTADNTRCRGNQGQNQNSIDLQFQGGSFPDGGRCNGNAYRGIDLGDLAIDENGRFEHGFSNAFVSLSVTGQFSPTGNSVSGSATVISFGGTCRVDWTATPST